MTPEIELAIANRHIRILNKLYKRLTRKYDRLLTVAAYAIALANK
jgi:hypothetical protein